MSPLVLRSLLDRDLRSSSRTFYPEVQPGERIQAILNSANLQGGGIVRLGPYTYYLHQTITIPENVTLVGVPRKTKLIMNHVAGSTQYGPVVKLNTKSRLVDCQIDLKLATGYLFTLNTATVTNPDLTTTDTGDATNNSTVALVGARATLKGCFIPGETSSAGRRRAVVVEANDCFVLNNEIEFPNDTYHNACIYLETGITGTIVVGNWCESTTDGDILYQSGTAHVVGATGILNYAKVATYV